MPKICAGEGCGKKNPTWGTVGGSKTHCAVRARAWCPLSSARLPQATGHQRYAAQRVIFACMLVARRKSKFEPYCREVSSGMITTSSALATPVNYSTACHSPTLSTASIFFSMKVIISTTVTRPWSATCASTNGTSRPASWSLGCATIAYHRYLRATG